MKFQNRFELILPWLIFVGWGILLFWNLGATALTDWDEAWYGDLARNFAQNGHLLTPIWNHQPFFDKPPLYLWFTAFAIKVFGQNEFSVRFFSVLATLGSGLLIYELGKELFNKRAGLISLIVLASTIAFIYRGRTGNLDNFLTFWLTLEIFSLIKLFRSNSKKWAAIFGIAMVATFLTKGFLAFIFPAILGGGILLTNPKKILNIKLVLSLVGATLIIVSWFLLNLYVNGSQFIDQFFANQIGKISTAGTFANTKSNFSLIFISYLKSDLKWWFILFIPGFFFSLLTWKNIYQRSLLIFFIILFIILSFAENKSNWFLIPLYPIVGLIIGSLLGKLGKWGVWVGLLIGVVCLTEFHSLYLVGDSSGDEARVAKAAYQNTQEGDIIYLTDFYYPTTVYYSQRKVYSLFSDINIGTTNSTWWILPQSKWSDILKGSRVFIIGSPNSLAKLKQYDPTISFETLSQSGDRVLVKKVAD